MYRPYCIIYTWLWVDYKFGRYAAEVCAAISLLLNEIGYANYTRTQWRMPGGEKHVKLRLHEM